MAKESSVKKITVKRFKMRRLYPFGDTDYEIKGQSNFDEPIVDRSAFSTTAGLLASLGDDGLLQLQGSLGRAFYEYPDGKVPDGATPNIAFNPSLDRAEISEAQRQAQADYEQALQEDKDKAALAAAEESLKAAESANIEGSSAPSE